MAGLSYKQFSKDEKLFGPFNPRVVDQLKVREAIIGKRNNRTTDDLLYFNSNNIWVKLSSGVDTFTVETANFGFPPTITKTGFSSNLAYDNILRNISIKDGNLTGGIFKNENNSDYILDENLGYRPKAGITNFSVTHQNLYGTIRSATVEFDVPSKTEFDILEKLYLRPGFSMLLEFGHSIYLENDGDLVKTGLNRTLPVEEWFSNKSINDINKAIIGQRAISDYNYDAVVGMVKNFNWTYNEAGGYNCSLEIISYGDLLEQLKMSTVSAYVAFLNNNGLEKEQVENTLQNLQCSLEAKLVTNDILPEEPNSYGFEFKTTFSPNLPNLDSKSVTNRYIPLYKFLEYANQVIAEDLKIKAFKFSTKLGLSSFVTFPEHTSANPFEILLPKEKDSLKKKHTYNILRAPDEGEVNDILNIFLNVDWLINLLKSKISDLEPTGDSYFNLLDSIVKTMNKRLGYVNDFDITYDEDRLEWIIIDRKVLPEKQDLPILNLYGAGSTAYNINLSSKISSELSSMIAIAAGTGNSFTGIGGFNIEQWNSDLLERHRYDNDTKDYVQEKKAEVRNILNEYEKTIRTFNSNIDNATFLVLREAIVNSNIISTDPNNSSDNLDLSGFESIQRKAMQIYFENYFLKEKSVPGLIPFELSFDLKGISGIKIGQSFLIDETLLLPESYKGRVGFVVTGLSQKVFNDNWVTSVKSQLIVLDTKLNQEPLVEDAPEEKQTESTLVRIPIDELKLSPNGLKLIKEQETIGGKPNLIAYPDAGNYAIGFGANFINGRRVREGETITVKQAEELLRVDVLKFENQVKSTLNVPLTQNEFDALISLTYNIGGGAFNTSTIARKLNRGQYESAANEFERWNKSQGKVVDALTRRRLKEKTLYLTDNPGD